MRRLLPVLAALLLLTGCTAETTPKTNQPVRNTDMRTPTETEFVNRMMIDPGTYTPTDAEQTYRRLMITRTAIQTATERATLPNQITNKRNLDHDDTPLDTVLRKLEETLDALHEAQDAIEYALTRGKAWQ